MPLVAGWIVLATLAVSLCVCIVMLAGSWAAHRALKGEVAAMRRSSQERMDQIAVVSHEMRTPLALIAGPVELLLEGAPGALTDQQRQFLATIRTNAEHLQAITEDVLVQSRIEAGLFTKHEEDVDLRTVGLRAVIELRTLHDYSIAYDCPGAPPIVRGDPRLLHQAITNLLVNACRYSGSELVVLRIQRQTVRTLVSIDDRGLGMSPLQRDSALARYGTSGSSRGGVGLGLLITKEIVRMHGGKLHIQTTPNAGTIATFAVSNAKPAYV